MIPFTINHHHSKWMISNYFDFWEATRTYSALCLFQLYILKINKNERWKK